MTVIRSPGPSQAHSIPSGGDLSPISPRRLGPSTLLEHKTPISQVKASITLICLDNYRYGRVDIGSV